MLRCVVALVALFALVFTSPIWARENPINRLLSTAAGPAGRAESQLAVAAAAIKKCDYDKWVAAKQIYDRAAKEAIAAAEQFGSRAVYDEVIKFIGTFPTYQIPCYEVASNPIPPNVVFPSTGAHPFLFLEGGGTFGQTTFNVVPGFNVNSSGVTGGFGTGILFDIPGSGVSIGPRLGAQFSSSSGSTFYPTTGFVYGVYLPWMFYQEAMIQMNLPFNTPGLNPGGSGVPVVWITGGIAEADVRVVGTTPGFVVTDTQVRAGATFSGGAGFPILPNVLMFGQYRGTVFPTNTIMVPGRVQTDFWAQGVSFGLELRY